MKRAAAMMILWSALANAECIAVRLLNRQLAPPATVLRAQRAAEAIFAGVGVDIMWDGRAPECRRIDIMFDQPAATGPHAEALAYAMPFEKSGTRIYVYFSRVAALSSSEYAGTNLGYVLAHEIGHVLEGQKRHSPEGVMKACWDNSDLRQMARQEMRFAPEDADWIRSVLAPARRQRENETE